MGNLYKNSVRKDQEWLQEILEDLGDPSHERDCDYEGYFKIQK